MLPETQKKDKGGLDKKRSETVLLGKKRPKFEEEGQTTLDATGGQPWFG